MAVGSVAAEWRSRSIGRLAVGSSAVFDVPGAPETAAVSVTRISPELFWIVGEAHSADGSVRRENMILRVTVPDSDSLLAADSADVTHLGPLVVDSIAATADVVLAHAAARAAPDGLVHARGDLVLEGGVAAGIVVVEGDLRITAPLDYTGVIIVRGRIVVGSPGVSVRGLLRVGADPPINGVVAWTPSAAAVQDVLAQSLMPRPIAGRRWGELY